jgi:nucleotide-binding universal stress UspA family protein
MSHHLLLAVDGSDHSMKAATLAGELSGKLGAPLTIVHVHMHGRPVDELARMAEVEHVLDGLAEQHDLPGAGLPRTVDELLRLNDQEMLRMDIVARIGNLILEHALSRAEDAGATDVSTRSDTGDYADAILDTAEAVGADMIVLGRRGLGQLRGLLMGSVSHKVAQHADCTVITVK